MKNFDMAGHIACVTRFRHIGSSRLGIDQHSLTDFLQALDDDPLARFDVAADDPLIADRVAHVHGSNRHLVAAIDYGELMQALEIDHRLLRNQQSSGAGLRCGSYPSVLTGTQAVAGIREQSRKTDCAGPDVNLAVGEIEPAPVRIGNAVGENQLEIQQAGGSLTFLGGREAARVVQIFLLAGSEVDLDRIYRGDCGDGAAGRADERSDLLLSDSREAVDGRRQAGESQIDARGLDVGLGGLYAGGGSGDLRLGGFYLSSCGLKLRLGRHIVLRGVIEILLGDRLLFGERGIAVYVELNAALIGLRYGHLRFRQSKLRLRLFQLALSLCEPALRLIERRLEGTGIDEKQQLAFANERALGIGLLDEVAGDFRFDIGVDQTVEGSDPLAVNRDVLSG